MKYRDVFCEHASRHGLTANSLVSNDGMYFYRRSVDCYEGVWFNSAGGTRKSRVSYYAHAVISVSNSCYLQKGTCEIEIIRGAGNIQHTERAYLPTARDADSWADVICSNFESSINEFKQRKLGELLMSTQRAREAAQKYFLRRETCVVISDSAIVAAERLCLNKLFLKAYETACETIIKSQGIIEPDQHFDWQRPILDTELLLRVHFVAELCIHESARPSSA